MKNDQISELNLGKQFTVKVGAVHISLMWKLNAFYLLRAMLALRIEFLKNNSNVKLAKGAEETD